MSNISRAIHEWNKIVGSEWIEFKKEKIESYEATTFLSKQIIKAVLKPKDVNEISKCLKIANKYLIPIYPISCGKNWGYGSKVPVTTDSVILDLNRMNNIHELNENLSYVVVEPGVTQSQLLSYLENKTSGRLWLDSVASSPNTSLIGNAMERGHGTTPYCDRISHSCHFQVVLPSGEITETGYGIFSNAKTKDLDSWGLGPAISHLFSQSNLGIVTRMTLMLYPRPDYMKIGVFSTNSDNELETFINWANQQRLRGILKAGPHIQNHFVSLIRLLGKYPSNLMQNKAELSETIIEKLCKEYEIPKWTVNFGLWGTHLEVAAQQVHLQETLPGIGKLKIWDEKELANDPDISLKKKKDLLNLYKQMSGNITGLGLTRPYWKNNKKCPENPAEVDLDKDRCGFISINPCCPFIGEDALLVSNLASKIILKYGFEPNITAYSTRARILQFHITLCFDRSNPDEDQRALECQKELTCELQRRGFYSCRLNITSMSQLRHADPVYLQLLKSIKNTLDVNNILSPGRYDGTIENKMI